MSNTTPSRPEEMRLGDLLKGLKVSHAWAILAAVLGLVIGAFSLGYKAHSLTAPLRVQEATMSEAEQEFFLRYNRYITARDNDRETNSIEAEQSLSIAERMLFELVHDWWKNQNTFSGTLDFQPEIIRKGFDPTKSRIVFADGAEFVIPPEIKQKVLDAE